MLVVTEEKELVHQIPQCLIDCVEFDLHYFGKFGFCLIYLGVISGVFGLDIAAVLC